MLLRSARAGAAYFSLTFGAGFLLGAFRVTLVVPRMGERAAELLEMPLMFVVILLSARFVVRRFALPARALERALVGVLGLVLLLAAELLLTVALQDRTLAEYISSRDPVSGSAYLAMLVLYAAMPLALARFSGDRGPDRNTRIAPPKR